MAQRSIETEEARESLLRFIEGHKLPFTADIEEGRKRSTDQNRLYWQWMNDIARDLPEDNAEGWRAYCKLHHGVPILRAADETFRIAYDEDVRPLPYELKLKLMRAPLDFGVTRKMKTKQMTQFLDSVWHEFTAKGVLLTDPDGLIDTSPARKAA